MAADWRCLISASRSSFTYWDSLELGAVRSMQEDLRGTPASRLYLQPTRGCFRRPVDQYKFKLVATTLPTSSLFPLTPPGRCKVLLPITIFKLASRGRRWFIIFQFNLYLFIYPLPPSLLICIPAVVGDFWPGRKSSQIPATYMVRLASTQLELGQNLVKCSPARLFIPQSASQPGELEIV